jgi:hypothetical protein
MKNWFIGKEVIMGLTVDSVYWFNSTVAQTLAALVGVIGMVTVYKFQLIENSKRDIMERTFDWRKRLFGPDTAIQTPDSLIKDLEGYEGGMANPYFLMLKEYTPRIINLRALSSGLRKIFMWFIIINLYVIFVSIVFIVFPDLMINAGLSGAVAIGFMIGMAGGSIFVLSYKLL